MIPEIAAPLVVCSICFAIVGLWLWGLWIFRGDK